MQHIINQMRLAAEQAQNQVAKTRYGIVNSYDPGAYACRVMLQPDNTLTGWLPIPSIWVGNGWGLFAPPSIGDQVMIEFTEGDIDSGNATLRLYSDVDRPLSVVPGEFWLVHSSGSFFKFTNDGKISMNTAVELDAGNITNTLHTLVTDAFQALYNSHTHPVSGGATLAPTQQMTTAHLTSILKAN